MRKELAERAKLDPLERLEAIRDTLLTEVENRLAGMEPLAGLGDTEAVMRSVKDMMMTISRLAEGGGDLGKMTQEVVSHMPKKKYDQDDDDDDESIH